MEYIQIVSQDLTVMGYILSVILKIYYKFSSLLRKIPLQIGVFQTLQSRHTSFDFNHQNISLVNNK